MDLASLASNPFQLRILDMAATFVRLSESEAAALAVETHCALGHPLKRHPRCRACTILLGAGHLHAVSADRLCEPCAAWAERRRRRPIGAGRIRKARVLTTVGGEI